MKTRMVRLELTGRDDLEAGTVALHFRPLAALTYRAGQHGLWAVPRGGVAAFTFASAPEEELVTLATSLASRSRLKRALADLAPGDRVRMLGPLSRFAPDPAAPSVVMLAQGIGITPFRSLLTHAARTEPVTGTETPSTLIHVGAGHAYRGETEAAAKQAFYPETREAFNAELDAVAANEPDATFMISGSRTFVSATTKRLQAGGIDRARLRRDTFYGWSGHSA